MRAASLRSAAAALALAALAPGCATAPALPLYRPALAPAFASAPATPQEPVAQFWRGFHDPELDILVARALAANADLRIARANLREARALARFAAVQAAPRINLDASAGRRREPDAQGVVQTGNAVGFGFDVLWEADLFGTIGNERRAAAAEALASEAQLRAAGVSVAAEVARNYFELRGLQERLRVAAAALETQRAALSLVSARLDAGRGDAFDTERASSLVLTTAASVPAFEAQLARTRYRLAVLCGQLPTALDARPVPGIAPSALARIASPQALLRRRPDIAAAEQQVAAAAARIGVARGALFPRLTLAGTLGLNAGSVGQLDQGNAYNYSLGASLVWTVLDFGRLRAQLGAASARGDAAVAAYEKTVLGALEETEGALAAFTRSQRETDALYGAARAAGQAAELARARFGAGRSDFLAVLDAEREQLAARDRLAQSVTGSATALVAVYRALAGGW
jgi:multidrug efflux system outer membrane protein